MIFVKYLKEKCSSEPNPKLPFKYSTNQHVTTYLFFRTILVPNDTYQDLYV